MVWVQKSESSLHFKLAFVGGGAPDIVSYIAAKVPDSHVEDLSDEGLRRTYACISPPDLGLFDGMRSFFHISGYEAPRAGQHADLANIDGVAIVIDARRLTLTWLVANQLLLTDLAAQCGAKWTSLARTILVNRDAIDPVSTRELQEALGDQGLTWIESTPSSGHGVFDTLKALVVQVLLAYKAGQLTRFEPRAAL